MPLPVRSLPVIQNWDCSGCAACCRAYVVRVSPAERERIAAQGWATDPALKGVEPVVWDKKQNLYRLEHDADKVCVFLGPDGRCRIHAKFGAAAKPMACRIYPFVMVPAGDHWRVGVRYACPTAAGNDGRPLPEHAADVAEYAGLMEADALTPLSTDPPPLDRGQVISWPDLLRFADAIDDLLADPRVPFDLRVRRVVRLAEVCKRSVFAGVTGPRLRQFLTVMAGTACDEVPAAPAAVSPPGWVGRTLFRQLAALYARKDEGENAGVGKLGRRARAAAVWRFTRGTGPVPRLHAAIPDTTFEAAELTRGPLSAEATQLLTRYYRVKVQSAQFFGPTNFRLPFWDGLDSLLLTFPVALWLARVLAADAPGELPARCVETAVRIVDDNFGFNPFLGSSRQAWAVRTLAERGELARLAAWYGR